MPAHQQLGQFTVAIGNRVKNAVMLGKGLAWTIGGGGELDAVHAHQLIQLAAQHLGQGAITGALNYPVMKIEVAFLLVVADTGLEGRIALVGVQHLAQLFDLGVGHALGGQAAGHAFQGFADFVEFDQFFMAQRDHSRAHMGDAHQQALAFQAMNRLAQRATADAIGARQFRLGDLAAGGDFALDDGGLDTPEDVLGHGLGIVLGHHWGFQLIQHIVDTFKSNAAKTSQSAPDSQRINTHCRQSSNNPPCTLSGHGRLPALAPENLHVRMPATFASHPWMKRRTRELAQQCQSP
eukprot:gene1041-1184_t